MNNKQIIINQIENDAYTSSEGLTEEMFLFASELLPLVNVDLLLINEENQILLSWRDDEYCGTGWHIPGGIIRHGETLMERLHKTAIKEIGLDVIADEKPIKISEVFLRNQIERNHFISFLYKCYLPKGFNLENAGSVPRSPGYLALFDENPGLVWSQNHYEEFLKQYFKGRKNI